MTYLDKLSDLKLELIEFIQIKPRYIRETKEALEIPDFLGQLAKFERGYVYRSVYCRQNSLPLWKSIQELDICLLGKIADNIYYRKI